MNAALRPRPRRRSPGRGLALALVISAVSSGLGFGACSRTHITPTHGRAFREAFAKQDANPGRKENKSLNGLDSQEAAIIAGSYRKGLAPKVDTGNGGNQLLMVSPNRGGGAEAAIAPSVPSGN
jgi:hypothetical protein